MAMDEKMAAALGAAGAEGKHLLLPFNAAPTEAHALGWMPRYTSILGS